MADINVERSGPMLWPWIIGLLVLALIVWALMEMYGTDTGLADGAQPDTTVSETGAAAPP